VQIHPSLSISAVNVAYGCLGLTLGWPTALILVSVGFFANEALVRHRARSRPADAFP
jgi:hypothetical protein